MSKNRKAMRALLAGGLVLPAALASLAPRAQGADAEKKKAWTEIAPSGSPKAVQIGKGDKTLTYYEVDADHPLEVKVTGRAKLHVQVRLELPAGAKGKIKETVWTEVDGKKKKKAKISVKPSKKWKAGDEKISGRRIVRLKVKKGEHTVTIGLSKKSTNKLLVRVVSKPKKSKETKKP